jgi:hypothetical protein
MAGVALGPAVGGALLASAPDAVWWGGALAVALTGAGLLRLGDRIPDPLVQAQDPPPLDGVAGDQVEGQLLHSAAAQTEQRPSPEPKNGL